VPAASYFSGLFPPSRREGGSAGAASAGDGGRIKLVRSPPLAVIQLAFRPSMDSHPFLLEQARLLVSRLERLSADSTWAHRASGCRGALLKQIEQVETAPAAQPPDWDRLAYLVDWGYDLLVKAARELRPDENPS
jgi:hypothetical protein